MITATSSPDRFGSLLQEMLRKNRPNMIYLFVLGFIGLPVQYLFEMFRRYPDAAGVMQYQGIQSVDGSGIYCGVSIVMMPVIWLVATLVIGIAGTNYMQNRRAVDLYHSLPLSRHQLLLANFTTTFVTVALPMTINYIITYLLAAVRFGFAPQVTQFSVGLALMDLLGWYVTVFAVTAIILLMATQVGSTFDTFLFSGVFLAALPILYVIHHILSTALLYGYSYGQSGAIISCLSPATLMMGKYLCGTVGWKETFGGALAIWLVAGVLILLAAMYEYKRRPSERAEGHARGGVAALLFRLLAVFVGGIGFGLLFYGLVAYDLFGDYAPLPVMLSVALFGALVFLLVEAVLGRGFGGMRRRDFITGAALVIVTVLYVGALSAGGMGFEDRIPTAAKVQSIEIDYNGRFEYISRFLSDESWVGKDYDNSGNERQVYYYDTRNSVTLEDERSVEIIEKLHQAFLNRHDQEIKGTVEIDTVNTASGGITITYNMANGSTLQRRYYAQYSGEIREALLELEDSAGFRRETNPLYDWSAGEEMFTAISVTDATGLKVEKITDQQQLDALAAALRTDLLEESSATYYAPSRKTVGYLYLDTGWDQRWQDALAETDFWSSFSIPITAEYKNTLELLKGWGLWDAVATSDWQGGQVQCWGYDNATSGLILFPAWDGSEVWVNRDYDSAALSKEQVEQLIPLAFSTHANNGADDCLYLSISRDGEYSLPLYLMLNDARAANIPAINELIDAYYGWMWDKDKQDDPIEPIEVEDTIHVE